MPPTPARRPEKVFPHGFEVMKCDCERGAPGPPRSRASPPPSLYGCGGFRHPQHHHHPSARESLSLDSTYSKGLYQVRAPRVPQDTTDTHTPSDPTHTSKLSSLAFSSHNQIFFTRTPLKSTSRCDPPSSSPASQLPPSSATIAPCEGGSSVEAVEAVQAMDTLQPVVGCRLVRYLLVFYPCLAELFGALALASVVVVHACLFYKRLYRK